MTEHTKSDATAEVFLAATVYSLRELSKFAPRETWEKDLYERIERHFHSDQSVSFSAGLDGVKSAAPDQKALRDALEVLKKAFDLALPTAK